MTVRKRAFPSARTSPRREEATGFPAGLTGPKRETLLNASPSIVATVQNREPGVALASRFSENRAIRTPLLQSPKRFPQGGIACPSNRDQGVGIRPERLFHEAQKKWLRIQAGNPACHALGLFGLVREGPSRTGPSSGTICFAGTEQKRYRQQSKGPRHSRACLHE